jgi:large subunit ribosomal protein L9e
MKYIVSEQELEIPEGVTVDVKARTITVKGPLGKLTKSFSHIPFEIRKENTKRGKAGLKFRMWLQKKKRNAVLGTVRSIIRNMITGVTVGYKFRMVLAYSHFPIVVNVLDGGKALEIKNFLGFKINKRIDAPEGVLITRKEEEKNNLTLQGIDLEKVSQVCARIQQSTVIQDKDLRSFLDGIYVQDARLEFND